MPYLLRRMRRRKHLCLLVGLSALLAGALVFALHLGIRSLERQVEAVIDNSVVTCAVTNLTGTQDDYLMLPDWAANLFQETTPESVHIPETSFLDYVRDVRMKFSMEADSIYGAVQVLGVTAIHADRSLSPQENEIEWLKGFDDSVFAGDDAACVLSEDLYSLWRQEDVEALTLKVKARNSKDRTAVLTGKVAGVLHGKRGAVYFPWTPAAKVCHELNGNLSVDCISATIKDNRKIKAFREKCADVYFARVDPHGNPQPWTASPIYENYPFALEIYDRTMNETVERLTSGIRVFRICQWIVAGLILALSLIVGNLSVKHRQRELALQSVLGLSQTRIYAEILTEYALLSVLSLSLGTAVLALLFRTAPPWGILAAIMGASCLGATCGALPILTNRDILLLTKTE